MMQAIAQFQVSVFLDWCLDKHCCNILQACMLKLRLCSQNTILQLQSPIHAMSVKPCNQVRLWGTLIYSFRAYTYVVWMFGQPTLQYYIFCGSTI